MTLSVTRLPILATAWAVSLMVAPTPTLAQEGIRLGPARLAPSFVASNIGIDTNVYNDPVDPEQDVTANLGSNLQIYVPIGGTRLSGRAGAGYTYFHEFASQRSLNIDTFLQWTVPLNRVSPLVSYAFTRSRGRPNLEIDERVEHRTSSLIVGTGIRLSSRAGLGIEFNRNRFVFGDDAQFLGTSLQSTLNRTAEGVGLSFTHRLTALTRLGVTADVNRQLFDFAQGRGVGKTYSIRPTVQFAPTALIHGTAEVGYGRFDDGSVNTPDFTGVMASVDLASTVRGSTRFSVRVARQVSASFTDADPYYVQTNVAFSVGQRLTDRWDLNAGLRREWLDYLDSAPIGATTLPALLPATSATQYAAHAGLGHRLSRSLGVGFSVEYIRRNGGVRGNYRGLRASTSINYGL